MVPRFFSWNGIVGIDCSSFGGQSECLTACATLVLLPHKECFH